MEWRTWGRCRDVRRTVAMLLLALSLTLFGQAASFVAAVTPDTPPVGTPTDTSMGTGSTLPPVATPTNSAMNMAPAPPPVIMPSVVPTAPPVAAPTDIPMSAAPAAPAASPVAAPTDTPMSVAPATRPGIPVHMRIPKIGVDAAIEQVGLTADGAMDTPKNFADTAWFQLGPRPGEQGNSVIAGHVDSTTGVAVFWDLRKLNMGDEIFVIGDDGIERRFIVGGWETYQDSDAPLVRIFGPTTSTHLNLITCDSNSRFERSYGSYTGALVLYADAAP